MNNLVSVCVPTYNGAKYLRESLECVVNQTYQNLEILIVDDQSTDDTVAISKEFQDKDSRIRLIQNDKNLGLVGNWNKCIEEASGEWIKLHFQDDLMVPETLEEMIFFAHKIEVRCVLTDREFFFEDNIKDPFGELPRLSHFFKDRTVIADTQFCELLNDLGIRDNFIGEPIIGLVQRDLFKIYGNYDVTLRQIVDFEFWLRIGLNEKVGFIPDRLHKFRIHTQSQGAKNVKNKVVNVASVDKVILSYKLMTHDVYSDYRKETSSEKVLKQTIENISRQICESGYFRMKKQVDKELFALFDRKVSSWIGALFTDLMFAIGLK